MKRSSHPSLRISLAAITVLFSLAFFAPANAQETLLNGWNVYDVGSGTKPSFDFDADGRLHVMGLTEAFPGEVWYARSDSADGPWNPQTVSTGYFYGPGDLRVDPSGTAHIAWHDHDDQDPHHITVTAAGEVQLNPIASPGHNGWDNSLAFDSQGNLYQTSVDPSGFGATNSLEFLTYDGNEWTHSIVPGSGSFMYGLNTSLAIDSGNDAHILYCDCADFTAPGTLNYARQTGDTWSITTVQDDGISGRFPVLAVDGADRPHAAWIDIDSNDLSRGRVQYGVLENGTWDIQTVDVLEDISLGFSGARKLVSLELDGEGNPHIAYGDRSVVKYATGDGGTVWDRSTLLESPNGAYNGLVVLRLDEIDDAPAIAFWEPEGNTGTVRLLSPEFDAIQPGDANGDGQFDQRDLFQIVRSGRFGTSADWEDGDWNGAPAGRLARPPSGDGVFNQADLDLALAAGFWLQGTYISDTAATSSSATTNSVPAASSSAAVPEPNFLGGIFPLLIGLALLRYRKQARGRRRR